MTNASKQSRLSRAKNSPYALLTEPAVTLSGWYVMRAPQAVEHTMVKVKMGIP
jgi:hypothetical protein